MKQYVTIIGGGLAGSEAAWQLAQRGYPVHLYEMRPNKQTGAHQSQQLAELVCSNSLGSKLSDRATGLLQTEISSLGSMLMQCALETAVPAGGALAVDREAFANAVTNHIETHPNIQLIREEKRDLPVDQPVIVASGPLTSIALSEAIGKLTGSEYLYFYDALSPIVSADSIDMNKAFRANRYDRGDTEEGDYINCPMTRDEYYRFVEALKGADTIQLRDFERDDPHFFEGCLPIEQIAARGEDSLAYGPMRPVGIRDPHTGRRPYAVVQLRRDNLAGTLYNIVGFQTNIKWGQQKEILRLIPGLENATFVRMGQMHRNTYINSPALLDPTMQFRKHKNLYFAGQITGVEGYVGNIATGLVAAINMARTLEEKPLWVLPKTTMLGSLCFYVANAEEKHFQPMKANFGILPELVNPPKDKALRKRMYVERAVNDLQESVQQLNDALLHEKVHNSS